MTYITGLALRRGPVTILAFILVLAAGVFTFVSLPVEVLPRVQFPLMTVNVDYPNAGSEEVVKSVTYPLEQHLNGLDNLETIQSTSIEGASILLLFYEYGSNMEEAKKELESRLVSIELPDGATVPKVGGIDPGSEPILQLSLTSEVLDFTTMSDIVDSRIAPALNSVEGVEIVSVAGVQEFQLLVQIEPSKLIGTEGNSLIKTPYQISITQIAKALRESNFSVPSGFQFDGTQMISVRTSNELKSIEEIENIPLIILEDQIITLGDVAVIMMAPSVRNSISRTNGHSSLGISVTKEPSANTVDVSKAALRKVRDVSIIEGIQVVEIYNAGPEIESQLNTLKSEGMYGFIFAVSGVFLFLLNIRKGFIKGLALSLRPTSVIALT
ncbi:MAG: efflux RND transporter permease subunit, partial [Chloroflexota bacterium]|nr:efflux RND transporter permease subunit [Chloroflexota bacterium]